MNGQTLLAPAELILEVAPGDPDWAAHFLIGFEQWLMEGGFCGIDPATLPAHCQVAGHADAAAAP